MAGAQTRRSARFDGTSAITCRCTRSGRSARRQPRGRCTGRPRRVGAGTRTGLDFSDLGAGGEGPVTSERSRRSCTFEFSGLSGLVPFAEGPGDLSHQRILHQRGVTPSPGLYMLGRTWQHTRGSALLGWVGSDAAFLAAQIGRR